MTTEMRKSERIIQLIDEVKVLGLGIQPPDIDRPRSEFTVREDEIVFGMGAVKGVGSKAIESIAAARSELGRDFADLFDLCEQVDLQKVNRKVFEALIHAGALDRLPGNRRTLIQNLERALSYGQRAARDREGGQVSLFGGDADTAALKPRLEDCSPYDPLERLSLERQAVGFFLSGHPFQEYRELVAALPVESTQGAAQRGEGAWVDLVGVITSHTKARDRHKRVYARAHFEDRSGMIGLVVYSRLYEQTQALVASDSILVIGGRVQVRSDGQREVVVDRITPVDEVLGGWTRDILLRLDLEAMAGAGIRDFGRLLAEFGLPQQVSSLTTPETTSLALGAAGEATTVCAEARPIPVVVDTRAAGKDWRLRSSGRNLALTLVSLRRLRQIPGVKELRLRVALPPPLQQPKRFRASG